MAKQFQTTDDDLRRACADFWHTYFGSMKELHARQGRAIQAPIKDRNLGTTDSRHIVAFEKFWRMQLAAALGVDPSEVGPPADIIPAASVQVVRRLLATYG